MRLLDIDWMEFRRALPAWKGLPAAARLVILERIQPGQPVRKSVLRGQCDALTKAGLLSSRSIETAVVERPYQTFCQVVRALGRNRVHDTGSPEAFGRYVNEHLTLDERGAFWKGRYHPDNWRWLHKRISSRGWLEEFLAATGTDWEQQYQTLRQRPFLYSSHVLEAAQILVRRLTEPPAEPVLFRDLQKAFPELSDSLLDAAIRAAIRYLLLFPSLRSQDLEPVLGIWPGLGKKLAVQPARAPEPVAAREPFHAAFLVDDMTSALVACAAQPPRLRLNDGRLFSKSQREMESSLVSIPPWVEETFHYSRAARLSMALSFLGECAFLAQEETMEADRRLEPTQAGRRWLALPAKQRLKAILDLLREDPSKEFLPYGANAWFDQRPDCLQAVKKAFTALEPESFIRLADFLAYHRQRENPLLAPSKGPAQSYLRIGGLQVMAGVPEELEQAWAQMLYDFLHRRLLPLGGVKLGIAEDRAASFCLTDVGRYLLDAARDFEFGEAGTGELVVQPNFDVVFLASSPVAEAEMARFAERRGRQVGVLFKITKKSILGAAAAGITGEQVVETLRQVSSRELPANVEREIGGWFSQCRRITMRPGIVIHCPDRETAARVLAAAGGKAVPITDTVLELQDPKQQSALARKLREMGVFV